MKRISVALFSVMMLATFSACQTPETASHSGNVDVAATGKCSQCDCKRYVPSTLIKGVCKDCGHTAAEHSEAPK